MEAKLPLRHARAQLRITQLQVAERAKLHVNTVIEAERKRNPINLVSAYAIAEAISAFRQEQGLSPLTYQQLDLWVSGEEK